MALLERRVLLVGIVIFVLLGIFAWFVLYQPRLKAQQESARQSAELSKELEETRQRVKGLPRLRQRKAELQEASAAFAARVIPRTQMLTMLRQLSSRAGNNNVRFLEIIPPGLDTLLQEENASTPLRAVPFMVTVHGRYKDIGRYVEGLDRFPYFVRVPDFEVVAREDIRPEVEVKLLVNLYASTLAAEGQL